MRPDITKTLQRPDGLISVMPQPSAGTVAAVISYLEIECACWDRCTGFRKMLTRLGEEFRQTSSQPSSPLSTKANNLTFLESSAMYSSLPTNFTPEFPTMSASPIASVHAGLGASLLVAQDKILLGELATIPCSLLTIPVWLVNSYLHAYLKSISS